MQLSRSVHGHCQGYTGHLRRFFLYQKEICFSQLEMKLTQPYESEIQCNLGVTVVSNLDVFLKKVRRGGVISDPKNYIADFLVSKRYILVVNFGKNVQKGGEVGESSPIQKISLQIYAS